MFKYSESIVKTWNFQYSAKVQAASWAEYYYGWPTVVAKLKIYLTNLSMLFCSHHVSYLKLSLDIFRHVDWFGEWFNLDR